MTSTLFLTGPLVDEAVLTAVLGRMQSVGAASVLRLYGWQAFGGQTGVECLIPADPDKFAAGHLITATAAEKDRVEFYLSSNPGYWVNADVGKNSENCLIWRAEEIPVSGGVDPDASPDIDDMRIAARGLMDVYGHLAAKDVPTRLHMLTMLAGRTYKVPSDSVESDPSSMGLKNVDVRSYRRRHDGFYALDEVALRHRRFDGETSSVLHREILVSMDAAILLPYDPVLDLVLLLEQFRPGPFLHSDPFPWILEPVAGRIDRGETAEQAAIRESREEAGLELHRLERIGISYPSPGLTNERYHCFLGLCDLSEVHSGFGGVFDEGEDIKSHILDFDALMERVDGGVIKAGPLMICALWLARHRDRLRAGA